MNTNRPRPTTILLGAFTLALLSGSALAEKPLPLDQATMPEKHFDLLDKYCLECHDALTEKGEVNLEDISFTLVESIETAETWNKVLNSINSGEMPPEDEKQMSDDEKTDLLRDLSERIVLARKVLSDNGGEIVLRRLNRREYANTLEELLGVRPDVSFLPDDAASSEYDTMGASLFFSSDQLENYLATARRTLELALTPKPQRPSETIRIEPEEIYLPLYASLAGERLERAKNYYSYLGAGANDEVAKQFGFLDAWQADRASDAFSRGFAPLDKYLQAPENRTGAALMLTIKDGFTQMKLPSLGASEGGKYTIRLRAAAYEDDPERFRYLEFSRRLDQNSQRLGWRKVTGTFKNPQIIEYEIDHPTGVKAAYWAHKRTHEDRGDKNLWEGFLRENGYGTPWGIWVDWFEIEGPHPAEPHPALSKIFFEKENGQTENDYAREVLQRFARLAFRGEEPSEEFIDKLAARYAVNRKNDQAPRQAFLQPLAIILSSPKFLYMIESTGNEESDSLTGTELAVRLSYFLWSAPPDEELLALGRKGKLAKPWVLEKQTNRLLKDERAQRFVHSFVHQWLELERLGMFAFAGRQFPVFDNAVRDSAREEVFQTVSTLMTEKLPLRHLLTSDFVVINDILAGYYGIEGVKGHEFRKVPVPAGSPRGGLLGTAAVMAMGSDGQRSSPVERGAWVLRHLLNDPPPPAPPNVPQLSRFEGELLSVRNLQQAHQEAAQCRQCHQKIDPIGYGLENFDAAGAWRDVELVSLDGRGAESEEFAIDPAGSLADGTKFSDYFDLRAVVANHDRAFAQGLVEALIAYGLGRPYGFTDYDLAETILSQTEETDFEITSVIHALVQSKPFQTK